MAAQLACPCGSRRPYIDCCKLLHDGAMPASPEALMRSRYTAYHRRFSAYLMAPTGPPGPHWRADAAAWKAELDVYCKAVTFARLDVFESSVDGDVGFVRFRATMFHRSHDVSFGERSRFLRTDRWRYVDGVKA